MKVESFVLGPVHTNTYLVYKENQGLVIDPGFHPEEVLARINELGLKIKAILLTHAHFDHIGGLEKIREQTGAPVYVHANEEAWLLDPLLNASGLWDGVPNVSCQPAEHLLQGNEILSLIPGLDIVALHTPGHTPGSITYRMDDIIFCGDVLFYGSIGRTDLPGGNHQTLINSIHEMLMPLPDQVKVLSGHGPETTIGRERRENPHMF